MLVQKIGKRLLTGILFLGGIVVIYLLCRLFGVDEVPAEEAAVLSLGKLFKPRTFTVFT